MPKTRSIHPIVKNISLIGIIFRIRGNASIVSPSILRTYVNRTPAFSKTLYPGDFEIYDEYYFPKPIEDNMLHSPINITIRIEGLKENDQVDLYVGGALLYTLDETQMGQVYEDSELGNYVFIPFTTLPKPLHIILRNNTGYKYSLELALPAPIGGYLDSRCMMRNDTTRTLRLKLGLLGKYKNTYNVRLCIGGYCQVKALSPTRNTETYTIILNTTLLDTIRNMWLVNGFLPVILYIEPYKIRTSGNEELFLELKPLSQPAIHLYYVVPYMVEYSEPRNALTSSTLVDPRITGFCGCLPRLEGYVPIYNSNIIMNTTYTHENGILRVSIEYEGVIYTDGGYKDFNIEVKPVGKIETRSGSLDTNYVTMKLELPVAQFNEMIFYYYRLGEYSWGYWLPEILRQPSSNLIESCLKFIRSVLFNTSEALEHLLTPSNIIESGYYTMRYEALIHVVPVADNGEITVIWYKGILVSKAFCPDFSLYLYDVPYNATNGIIHGTLEVSIQPDDRSYTETWIIPFTIRTYMAP